MLVLKQCIGVVERTQLVKCPLHSKEDLSARLHHQGARAVKASISGLETSGSLKRIGQSALLIQVQ